MNKKDAIVVGGGPCGLAAAICLKELGKDVLVIEKGNIVNAIYRYPTHQTFFSSSQKLEIGNIPFVTVEHKPNRNQALTYYREVVKRKAINVNAYEKVESIIKKKIMTSLCKQIKRNINPLMLLLQLGIMINQIIWGSLVKI